MQRNGLETDVIRDMRADVESLKEKVLGSEKCIKNLEFPTYDGVIVWKITEYTKRKQQTKRADVQSLKRVLGFKKHGSLVSGCSASSMHGVAAGPSSMDTEFNQQAGPPSSVITGDEFDSRPNFVREAHLKETWSCNLCHNILVQPQQTVCGNRVCKRCIQERFGTKTTLNPCPLNHDPDDDNDLECEDGLMLEHITPDPATQQSLRKEKVFCDNKNYGCPEQMLWKKLREHLITCKFYPIKCPSRGCHELLAPWNYEQHINKDCLFVLLSCQFCGSQVKRGKLQEHLDDCTSATSHCKKCKKSFKNRYQLNLHESISRECLSNDTTCYYCQAKFNNRDDLKKHLKTSSQLHLENMTYVVAEMNKQQERGREKEQAEIERRIRERTQPILRTVADSVMDVKKLKGQVEASVVQAGVLEGAMKDVNKGTQLITSLKSKVEGIERTMQRNGLETDVIRDMRADVESLKEKVLGFEKRIKNLEFATYDGVLVWKITEYTKRKQQASVGRMTSLYSHPFYSSKTGYKMCCRVYLNGDGVGRDKYLSIFFVVMKGEYDDLLKWPFKQRVTFCLLAPGDPSANKTETFIPDSDSTSFQKPHNEMNIASGCPQFLQHSEVESSKYRVNDCIYIKIKVEPGGDAF